MTNTRKITRIGVLLLVLCLVSTTMVAGTFAKYTSEYAGKDTALIAKWKIAPSVGGTGFILVPGAIQLDLFSHDYDTNIVEGAGDQKIIAPGVQGDFTIQVANTGDVAAQITFDLEATGTASMAPIEYSLTGTEGSWVNINGLKSALNQLKDGSPAEIAPTNGTLTQAVYWRWAYNPTIGSDPADTGLGTASAAGASRTDYILTITATATQIAPDITPSP